MSFKVISAFSLELRTNTQTLGTHIGVVIAASALAANFWWFALTVVIFEVTLPFHQPFRNLF